ncbi:KAT8 regulatory NSL complex subunit 1-like isoform X2 [Arapaima gigas]
MAAMAPALTDAPADAHHMRFKLAPPTSTLSPGSVENNSNASNILVTSNGPTKRRPGLATGEEHPRDRCAGGRTKEEAVHAEAVGAPLGKLQPLVASYLCSDVTPVASHKDSRKLQGVLLKQKVLKNLPASYFNSSDYLPLKHQTLELSGEQLKSIVSGATQATAPQAPQAPVNGLAKKVAKPVPEWDPVPLVNGGGSPVSSDCPQPPAPETVAATRKRDSAVCVLLKGGAEQEQQTAELPQSSGIGSEQTDQPAQATDSTPKSPTETSSRCPPLSGVDEGGPVGGDQGTPTPFPSGSFGDLDAELRERTLLSQSRQGEIEGRLRRLRKRLQVVQAKQVERHVRQQLGGFLQTAFSKLPSPDGLWVHGQGAPSRQTTDDGLSLFLRSGSVSTQLERLSLSGTAYLRTAESAFDSDATESSSGGETDVEEDELATADAEQRHVSLWRRAEGRYAMERASIISHWNWLQAQVSDLEYRIRQHTDIYRQIRTSKASTQGLVTLGDAASCEESAEDGTADKGEPHACQVTQDASLDVADSTDSDHSLLWKGCVSGRPVNGMVNSVHPGLPDCASPESSDAEELLGKRQRLPLSSGHDGTCVAARTRPVTSWKKRRLVRPGTTLALSHKRPGRPGCGCPINVQCVTCVSCLNPSAEFQYERPPLERLSQFDPCVHPILSFTDDVSMNLHLQRVMKSHWQNRPLEKTKTLKKLSLKHKMLASDRLLDASSVSCSSKDKKMPSLLNAAVRFSHHKIRQEKFHRQNMDGSLRTPKQESGRHRSRAFPYGVFDRSHVRKRSREHSLERLETTPKLFVESGSPCSSTASTHTSSPSPLMRQCSASLENSPAASLSSQSATTTPPIRRRRGESSFDINNIVIPMSVAATTRVEKLQYKEILTPSWREVDVCAQPVTEENDGTEIEDLSDSAFAQLHLPYEEQERSRWTWAASSVAKRRGSRSYKSLDGRTTPLLGGTNPSTPQPSSPETTHFHALQDYGPAASPCSPASPDTMLNPQRLLPSEDTRCSTPDFTFEELLVQPWERRTFPLERDPAVQPEDQAGPAEEQPSRGLRRFLSCKGGPSKSECENGPPSPHPSDGTKQKGPASLRTTHR